MINSELAKIFDEMGILLEMKGVDFKPRAYEKAASAIEMLEEPVSDIYKDGGLKALEDIPGVGKSIAEKIEEYIKTKHIKEYAKLKKEIPVDIEGLSAVEGIGPKTILHLYKKLKIKTRNDLEKAAKAGKLKEIEGLGEKSEEKILQNIGFLKTAHGRFLIGTAMPLAKVFLERFKKMPEVKHVEFAGSLRRRRETIGDLDFIAFSDDPDSVIEKFVKFPEVKHVYSKGERKTLVRLVDLNIDSDLAVISPKSMGSALIAWTGNKQHNIMLRALAEKKGLLLNDYGLWKGKKLLASKTEEEVYKALGMEWIPPEMREGGDEIKMALEGKLPKLIDYNDIKGDLQVHSDWTDGAYSMEEMAKAAKEFGHEYICFTDHTKSLAMTHGNDEKEILKQIAEIKKLNESSTFHDSGFTILAGAEVNIMKDGSLDIKDEVLAQLDVVGAAVHSNFNLSEKEMTERIIKAMENPNVDILFHPTGRLINRREPYKVDMEAILKAAKRTKTILEIDASPDRLDLKDEYVRRAIDMGIKLSIDTDSHSINSFEFIEYGIGMARRGWAKSSDIINTRSVKEMLRLLKQSKS